MIRRMRSACSPACCAAALVVVAGAVCSGCVRRTVTITSEPPGALVWLNEREVGRTPVTVDFLYYGRYDVQLERDGYEPLMTSARAKPPVWDSVGLDFFAELFPAELHSRNTWHFELQSLDDDVEELLDRAAGMRDRLDGAEPTGDGPSDE